MNIDRTSDSPSTLVMFDDQNAVASELGGDVGARVSALLLVQSHERSEANQAERHAIEERLQASEEEQVARMRDRAAYIRTAGAIEGGAQILSGGCQMAAGGFLIDGRQGTAKVFEGAGQLATGAGKFGASGPQGAAAMADADSVAASHRAEAAKRMLDDLRDDRKDIADGREQSLNMLSGLRKTEDATYQAALSQRI
jgi:hypothetical protein